MEEINWFDGLPDGTPVLIIHNGNLTQLEAQHPFRIMLNTVIPRLGLDVHFVVPGEWDVEAIEKATGFVLPGKTCEHVNAKHIPSAALFLDGSRPVGYFFRDGTVPMGFATGEASDLWKEFGPR